MTVPRWLVVLGLVFVPLLLGGVAWYISAPHVETPLEEVQRKAREIGKTARGVGGSEIRKNLASVLVDAGEYGCDRISSFDSWDEPLGFTTYKVDCSNGAAYTVRVQTGGNTKVRRVSEPRQ